MPDWSRRQFLTGSVAAGSMVSAMGRAQGAAPDYMDVVAKPAVVNPIANQAHPTKVWGYNGLVAGQPLRYKQGEKLKINFKNRISQPTSVHWHGLRIPNAMDGVGSITQPGVMPGEDFVYEFELPDAGFFWYHPHMNSEKQIARGLFGSILVEEKNPPPVDREVLWTLYDWSLESDYQLPKPQAFQLWRGMREYGVHHKITTDGVSAPDLKIRRGERVRLRIANTSGNRRYALRFVGQRPWVIAWDGNGVEPYQLKNGLLSLATGARVDLILDGDGVPGQSYPVIDEFSMRFERGEAPEPVCSIVYTDESPLRALRDLPPPSPPERNPIAEPDLSSAEVIEIDMDQQTLPVRDLPKIGKTAELLAISQGFSGDTEVPMWRMNGRVLFEDLDTFLCIDPEPLFNCKLGKSYRLRFANKTGTDHPMHLHGHTFKMISKNGNPYPANMYRDTAQVMKDETVEVAFLADNVGDWMIHCHRGLHLHGGMMSLFTVS